MVLLKFLFFMSIFLVRFFLNLIFAIGFTCLCFSTDKRLVNPDPKRFASSFEKFKEEDESSISKRNNVTLFTGSSSIRRWCTLSTDFPNLHLLNRGFGGAHISDVLHFYNHLFLRYKPDRIVFYCGENDLWSGKSTTQVFRDFKTLCNKISDDFPNATFIYLSCKPSPKRFSKWNTYQSLNLKIKNYCLREPNLTFVSLSHTLLNPDLTFKQGLWDTDNLHVNQDGYNSWKRLLSPLLFMNKN